MPNLGPGTPPRRVFQPVAVALYILGAGPGSTAERARIELSIGHDTDSLYVWRTVNLLASMASHTTIALQRDSPPATDYSNW